LYSLNSTKIARPLACLSILLLVGCSSTTATTVPPTITPQPVTLSVSGSGEVWPVLGAVEPQFAADVPGYHLDIQSGFGTDAGADAVIKGVLDIGTMNRAPNSDQTAKGVSYLKFGVASVAIFTHPGVGIKSLTLDQVRSIYSGDIINWSKVGGPDLPIIVYNRGGTGGSVGAMATIVFQNIKFGANLQSAKTQEDMRNNVAATPGSIGFGAWPPILAAGTKVTAVAIDGVSPDNAKYPILEDLGMAYLGSQQAKIKPLMDWLQSKNGQTQLAKYDVFTAS